MLLQDTVLRRNIRFSYIYKGMSLLRYFVFILGMVVYGSTAGALTIVTTTSQIGDVTQNIVGALGRVITLMGSGVDPHMYQPTRSDMVHLIKADVIFYNGLYLEGRMEETLNKLASQKVVRAVGAHIQPDKLLSDPTSSGHFDPHIWMDVLMWREAVAVITDVVSTVDPQNEQVYRENARKYGQILEELDRYIHESVRSIGERSRILVTAHDAFNYFGSAYGFRVIGIQGISTESEAGLRRIEEIVDLLVTYEIRAVFTETSVSDRHVRALIEGARVRGHQVRIGGTLFSDAMGNPGTYEGTYVGMMTHNVNTITQALLERFSLRSEEE